MIPVEVAFSVGFLLGFGLIWCLIVVWVRGFVCGWLTWVLFVDSVLDSLICRVGVVVCLDCGFQFRVQSLLFRLPCRGNWCSVVFG